MQLFAPLMLVLLTLIWGLTFPATKAALETITPWQFLAFRFMIGSILFVPILVYKSIKRGNRLLDSLKNFGLAGAGVGVLLLTGFALQTSGMKYTSASRSGFFTGLLTLMVPIFALTFKTSKTSYMVWLALPIALIGIYMLSDPNLGGLNRGDLLTIGCAVVFALQMVSLEAVNNRLKKESDESNSDNATDVLVFVQMLIIGVGCTLLAVVEGKPVILTSVGWWAIAYTAIFGSVIAVWLQTRYQPKVPVGYAGMVFTLEPLWAAFFAWVLLGDSWTTRGLIGAGCVIVAMAISSLGIRNGQ